ncbi:DUF2802 domain-containing protein [Acidihalobacter ferrooxydans]|uniref:DUF2802 domain-containing protein n=1 Tax=Acidihalobacter ferrooxydans TaxID=1765967 RepID=A0A1P8UGS8_9GAMM|nr:DUF2802 domain-containing protein [Acidihalobacter ferrooxydans]APZ43029.1 hypothetical protein BW247_07925 [Acidihalobacter ferrooxydans]
MQFDWLSILIALDLIYFPLFAVWAAWQALKFNRAGYMTRTEFAKHGLEGQIEALREELEAAKAAQAETQARLGAGLEQLRERVDALELRAQSGGVHVQALRLLESGMDVDELASACDLSRGEVELLQALHAAGQGRQPDQAATDRNHSGGASGARGDSPLSR